MLFFSYHTCINRIQMLYAKNLREKFNSKCKYCIKATFLINIWCDA